MGHSANYKPEFIKVSAISIEAEGIHGSGEEIWSTGDRLVADRNCKQNQLEDGHVYIALGFKIQNFPEKVWVEVVNRHTQRTFVDISCFRKSDD